jgi:uncharacterized protein (TIGR02453 family)
MLQATTIKFLEQLSKNNNKPWFDAHRDNYEAAKGDFEASVGDILTGLAGLDPAFKDLKAKDCVMRIFRDVRFSKDKTPYKTNFGAGFSKGGRKFMGAGYYLHVQPGNQCFAGGGIWMPDPAMLKAVRQEIDYNFKEFKSIIDDKKFKKYFSSIEGEHLKKLPQGYAEDNAAIEFLKMKSFTVSHNIPDSDITGKGFEKKVVEVYATMKPFVDFLNRAAG